MVGKTDLSLVQRVRQHDPDALAELYDRYSTPVYSLALFITQDARLAEEATLDAFMQLWTRVEIYQDLSDHFHSWILVIARHCAIDLLRHELHRTQSQISLDEASFVPFPDTHAKAEGHWQEIQRILNHLPPEERQVIMLGFYRGLNLSEIATHLNTSLRTIKTRARLGLNKLRQELSQ